VGQRRIKKARKKEVYRGGLTHGGQKSSGRKNSKRKRHADICMRGGERKVHSHQNDWRG